MQRRSLLTAGLGVGAAALAATPSAPRAAEPGAAPDEPFNLPAGISSRSVTPENPRGEAGAGGRAAGQLGPGRKGRPFVDIDPGQTYEICDVAGPGVVRNLWATMRVQQGSDFRDRVLRIYWDDQSHPSVECPIGDFFGIGHGYPVETRSAAHSVQPGWGLRFHQPMPFARRARITLSNEGARRFSLFYAVDLTIGDRLPEEFGRLHVAFNRQNPTRLRDDFIVMPQRQGRGRFLGAVIGVRQLAPDWWGEGEMKMYIDGDTDPTICGTGVEDYIGQAWGLHETMAPYGGCPVWRGPRAVLYRWHLPDPIYWNTGFRAAFQQIGWSDAQGFVERQDDWSAAAFWYEPTPSAPLPALASHEIRVADLPQW